MLATGAAPHGPGIHTFLSLRRDDVVSGKSRRGCLIASSKELGGTTPSYENRSAAYRAALRERVLLSADPAAQPESDADQPGHTDGSN